MDRTLPTGAAGRDDRWCTTTEFRAAEVIPMGPDEIPTEQAAAAEQPHAHHQVHHMKVSDIEPLRDLPEDEGPSRHEDLEFEPGPSFGTGV